MGNGCITSFQFKRLPITYDVETAFKDNNGLIPCTIVKGLLETKRNEETNPSQKNNASNKTNISSPSQQSVKKGYAHHSGPLISTMCSILGTFQSPEVWKIFFKLDHFSLIPKLLQYSDENEAAFIKANGVNQIKNRILLYLSHLNQLINQTENLKEIDDQKENEYTNKSQTNNNISNNNNNNKNISNNNNQIKNSEDDNEFSLIDQTIIEQEISKLTSEELQKKIIDLLNIYIYISSGSSRFISSILLNIDLISAFPKSMNYFEVYLPSLFETRPVDFVSVLHKQFLLINLIKEASLHLSKDSLSIIFKIIKETSKQTTSVSFFSDLISCLSISDCRPFYELILDIFTEELTIMKQGTILAFQKNGGYKPLFDLFCNVKNSYLHLPLLRTVYTLAWADDIFLKELTPVILQLLPTIIHMFPKKKEIDSQKDSNSNSNFNSIESKLTDIILSEDQKIELRQFLAPSLISDIFHLISDPFKFTPSFIPLLAFVTFIYKGTGDNLDKKLTENWEILGDLLQDPNIAAALTEVPYWVYWLMILCQASFKTDDDIGHIIAIILSGSCRKGNEKPLCELFSSLNSISTLHNIDSTQTRIKVLTRVFKDWPNSENSDLA